MEREDPERSNEGHRPVAVVDVKTLDLVTKNVGLFKKGDLIALHTRRTVNNSQMFQSDNRY